MKAVLSFFLSMLTFTFFGQGTVQFTAPYFENFDSSFFPGTGTSNVGATIDANWYRNNYPFGINTEFFWGGGTGASSTQNTGPSFDHTTGNGYYAYAESSNYKEDRAKLYSPLIDLDTLSNPQLTFWKHQFGSDVKNFSVQITVNGFWGGSIYFTNGSQSNQWEKITIPLTNYIGQTVSFIFIAGRNTEFPGNGLADCAIDDVKVDNPPSCPLPIGQYSKSTTGFSVSYDAINSSGQNINYDWDFGDGNIATGINGSHTYSNAGIFNLSLIVTDACGQTDTVQNQVTVCDTAISNFNYSKSGTAVTFDASAVTFGASQYSWDYGDGNQGSGKISTHTYNAAGVYNVILTVTDFCGNTYSISETITSCTAPEALWSYQVVSTTSSGMLVQFFGQNSTGATSYFWDFGDGNTNSSSSIPSHTYVTPGLFYNVTLIVTNSCEEKDTLSATLQSLSVGESNIQTFKVYPNPASELLNVESINYEGENLRYSIYNILGALMRSDYLVNDEPAQIEISDLNSGIYFLKIESSKGIRTVKFQKR